MYVRMSVCLYVCMSVCMYVCMCIIYNIPLPSTPLSTPVLSRGVCSQVGFEAKGFHGRQVGVDLGFTRDLRGKQWLILVNKCWLYPLVI